MVTGIKIGFQYENEIKYLEILGKVILNEVNINQVSSFDWDKFEENGYSKLQPTYPMIVEGN